MKPFVVLDNWHIDQPPTRFELALSNSQLPFKVYKTNRGEFPDTLEASGVFVGSRAMDRARAGRTARLRC